MALRSSVLFEPVDALFTFVGETCLIAWDAVKRLAKPPYEFSETVNQMAFIGAASVPIVLLTTFFSGAVLSLYMSQFLKDYGATTFIGATTGLSVAREIGPVITGIMVAARCGSAMAAQIGTMRVTEQIDALKMLSVHPTNYLVIPRMIAGFVMLPILTLMGMYAGVLGALLVAMSKGISSNIYLHSLRQYVEPHDFIGGTLKAPVFGLIIALVACQQGMRTKDGAVGVGRATTNAVVLSMVLIYIANYILASWLF